MAAWQPIPVVGDLPEAVSGATAVEYQGAVYFFGGNGAGYKYFGAVWRLTLEPAPTFCRVDPEDGPKPVARNGHTASRVGSVMYVVCGYTGSKYLNDVWGFHLDRHEWSLVSNGNFRPRFMHSTAAVGDRLYVYGGLDMENVLSDGAVFDTTTKEWRPLPSLRLPRCNHSASIHGRGMYVFGGYQGQDTCLQDLWRFDLDTETWAEVPLADPPARRSGHSAAVHGATLVVFGGFNGESLNDVQCIDLEGRRACEVEVTSAPCGRCYHAAAVVAGRLLVFAGIAAGKRRLADLHALPLNDVLRALPQAATPARVWTPVAVSGDKPSARSGCAFACVGPTVYLFGGIDDLKAYRAELYSFDLPSATFTNIPITANPTGPRLGLNQAAMVWHRGRLVVFGGYGDLAFSAALWSVDPATGVVVDHTVGGSGWPAGRQGHSAVLWGDTLAVYGGKNFGGLLDDLCLFDLSGLQPDGSGVSWKELHVSGGPGASFLHTATLFGAEMLLLGGRGGYTRNTVWALNLPALTWRELPLQAPPGLPPRTGHAAALYGAGLCVVGGYDGRDLGDVWLLDLGLGASDEEGACGAGYTAHLLPAAAPAEAAGPVARCYHAAAVWGDTLFVLLGCGDRALADVLTLHLA